MPNIVDKQCCSCLLILLNVSLFDTNAYKLQASLSERVVVDGHGYHIALNFSVKANENQDTVRTILVT